MEFHALVSSRRPVRFPINSAPYAVSLSLYAQCLLKDWRSAEQLAENCFSDARYRADFFESLSSIAIGAKRSRISDSDAEGRVFTRPRVPESAQIRLKTVAAKCLKRSLDLSTPLGISSSSVYCRW